MALFTMKVEQLIFLRLTISQYNLFTVFFHFFCSLVSDTTTNYARQLVSRCVVDVFILKGGFFTLGPGPLDIEVRARRRF